MDEPMIASGTESDPEDPVGAAVRCGESVAPTLGAEDLRINANADATVGLDLLRVLGESRDNVLLSPMSLRSAFGQVYAGTSGASRDEIGAVLQLDDLGENVHTVLGGVDRMLASRTVAATENEPGVDFRPANRSFFDTAYESKVDPDWVATVQEDYGVCVEVFDMNADHAATLAHINGWVAEQTHGLIPQLVKFLGEDVALLVVNAVYFQASWATPFGDGSTERRPFTTRSGEVKDVTMMHSWLMPASYAEGDGWVAVGLPYTDGRLEMVVLLPDVEASSTFEEDLDAALLDTVFATLSPETLVLSLPKFTIRSEWELSPALQSLGMQAPFTNGKDFEGIAEGLPPILAVFHDVAIGVDEKGTEAAAATAVEFADGGIDLDPQHTVNVDHTFYVAIRDREAQSVMFFARIGDPSTSS